MDTTDTKDPIEEARKKLNGAAEYQVKNAPAGSQINSICAADVKPEKLEWLWPGRIPLGKLTILAGDPGLGKSLLTAAIATHTTLGTPWPVDGGRCAPGNVIMLSAEDDRADTIVPRLMALGADLARVHLIEGVKRVDQDGRERDGVFNLEHDVYELCLKVAEIGAVKLVVIDPISAYLGNTDSHNNAEVRGKLTPLVELAQRSRLAVLLVSHLNKSSGKSASYRVTGSIAFTASPRSSYLVAKDQDDPKRRLVMPGKNNLAPDMSGLAYRVGTRTITIEGQPADLPILEWEVVPVEVTADEALTPKIDPGPEPDERKRAEQWLRQVLMAGPKLQREVQNEALNGEDISKATLKRAKKNLGIKSYQPEKPNGPWWWELPRAQVLKFPPSAREPEHLEPLAQNQQLTQAPEAQDFPGAQVSEYRGEPEPLGVSGTIEQAISGLPITTAELLDELAPEDLDDIRAGDMTAANIRALAQSIVDHRDEVTP